MGLIQQIIILTEKDLRIVGLRRWKSTILRALIFPIAYIIFIAYARNFFLPPSVYGFGTPRPIRDLTTEVFGNSSTSLGGRDRVVFIHNGYTGGQIETLINRLSDPLREAGADVRILPSEDDLLEVCQSSLSGFSRCYASASFSGSPTEGNTGSWSYTARIDAGLGFSVYVGQDDNAAQIHVLPFIQAIDAEIGRFSGANLPSDMLEYPFTYETIQDRENDVQQFFMRALGDYLAVTLFIAACGITFHISGYIAVEREAGISSLIDVMSHDARSWITLTARLASHYSAFAIVYVPGWLGIGAVVSRLIFVRTPISTVLPFHIMLGLSLTGYSLFFASFFRRAQLSGVTVLIFSLVIAVVAQFAPRTIYTTTALSALFPPATYTLFAISLSPWEAGLEGARIGAAVPYGDIDIPLYLFYVFLTAQIIVYPLLAAFVQRLLHGTSRRLHHSASEQKGRIALGLLEVSKTFGDSWFYKLSFRRKETVKAVAGVSLSINRGQLVSLLGVNGSGKSTLIAGITGTQSFSSGSIQLDRKQNIGLCPQTNVAWDDLTVYQNVRIFSRLKGGRHTQAKGELLDLISACDLTEKARAYPRTLSGGQKRKLQLAMAFAGHSKLCCIDEVSSGLDPLSRRTIWKILLAERGERTIILTTHALDEADALSDHVAIMSAGQLVAEGSSAELKEKYGGGYRIQSKNIYDRVSARTASKSSEVVEIVDEYEAQGHSDISVRGPSIEDVFMALARKGNGSRPMPGRTSSQSSLALRSNADRTLEKDAAERMTSGTGTSFLQQVRWLFHKRLLVFRRNWLPYVGALALPIIVAALGSYYFLDGFTRLPCSLSANANEPQTLTLAGLEIYWGILVPVGPRNRFSRSSLPASYSSFSSRLRIMDSYGEFDQYIHNNFRDVVPGGFYLGYNDTGSPLMAYRINGNPGYAALAKNIADSYLMGERINAEFSTFALPFASTTGDSLQLILYLGLALAAYPAFLSLYPTFERLRNVRALHYSNGVRPAPLWLAYSIFDGLVVLILSIIVIAVLTSLSNEWFAPGYLFVAIFLYGISSTLVAYVVSLFSKTQLGAFAVVAGYQAISLLLDFVMYMVLLTFGTAEELQNNLNTVQYTFGLISPAGCLLRVLLLSLNQSQLLCRAQSLVSYPADITVYGAPYLYFVLQSLALFTFLVAYDSGWRIPVLFLAKQGRSTRDLEKHMQGHTDDVVIEQARTETSNDELKLLHLCREFQHKPAVDDVTLGVRRGEILALLGPNGAGKTTTIALIRGDLRPSSASSEVLIAGHSVKTKRLAARAHLGVCPQFNTTDRMTVAEHLKFYARIRGVPDAAKNVEAVMEAVGLTQYRNRRTVKLSGGNHRKLSLASAIVGNPTTVLLDEPSSGMDPLAAGIMQQAIRAISPNRAVVITTHSMEEASALSHRAAILDAKILTIGSPAELRDRHGKGVYELHVVYGNDHDMAPVEMQRLRGWVVQSYPAATLLDTPMTALHGQDRFQVAIQDDDSSHSDGHRSTGRSPQLPTSQNHLVGLMKLLEESKPRYGVEYYSISRMTLEDVFLEIVSRNRQLR